MTLKNAISSYLYNGHFGGFWPWGEKPIPTVVGSGVACNVAVAYCKLPLDYKLNLLRFYFEAVDGSNYFDFLSDSTKYTENFVKNFVESGAEIKRKSCIFAVPILHSKFIHGDSYNSRRPFVHVIEYLGFISQETRG